MIAYSEASRRAAEGRGRTIDKRLDPEHCDVCAHIAEHGWTGLDRATHCRACHAVWGGQGAHCSLCHRTFSSNGVLELAHSTYRDEAGELRRRCHDPAACRRGQRPAFGEPELNPWGVPIWRTPAMPPDALDRRRSVRSSASRAQVGQR